MLTLKKRLRMIIAGVCILAFGYPLYLVFAASLMIQAYLPIVYKAPSYTPTPTPPPVLLPNGDFEQGPVVWTQYSKKEWPLIVQEFPVNVYPYDGTWAAWLGGSNDEFALIQQQVGVPFNLPYLSYWYWIDSSDDCGFDFGYVFVNGEQVEKVDLCNATGGWVQKVIDLRVYAGSSVLIQILVECNAFWVSDLLLDHFTFQASQIGATFPSIDGINTPHGGTLKQDVLGK